LWKTNALQDVGFVPKPIDEKSTLSEFNIVWSSLGYAPVAEIDIGSIQTLPLGTFVIFGIREVVLNFRVYFIRYETLKEVLTG